MTAVIVNIDEADESVGVADVEQAITNPITKLETIRKLVTQGSEMPHGEDENGRGNRYELISHNIHCTVRAFTKFKKIMDFQTSK